MGLCPQATFHRVKSSGYSFPQEIRDLAKAEGGEIRTSTVCIGTGAIAHNTPRSISMDPAGADLQLQTLWPIQLPPAVDPQHYSPAEEEQ